MRSPVFLARILHLAMARATTHSIHYVKEGNVAKVKAKWSELMAHWRAPAAERESA
jgi:hypothetical protein